MMGIRGARGGRSPLSDPVAGRRRRVVIDEWSEVNWSGEVDILSNGGPGDVSSVMILEFPRDCRVGMW